VDLPKAKTDDGLNIKTVIPRHRTNINEIDLFFIKGLILAVLIFALSKIFKKLHPVALIALSAVVGIIFNFA